MPTTERASTPPARRKRAANAASNVPALDALSPLAVFRASVRAAVPATLTREALMAVEPCDVIGEHGINFDGTQWWSAELRPYVSLPPAARKRPLAAEIRWDAAARTRRQLTSITLMLRDELGRVVKTIPCRLRSIEQLAENREKDRAATRDWEKGLKERRTDIQLRATARFAGPAAARTHADLVDSPTPPTTESGDASDDAATPARGPAPSTTARPTQRQGRARRNGATTRAPSKAAPSASAQSARPRRATAVPPPPVAPEPTAMRKGSSYAALAHTLAGGKPPAGHRS